MGTTKAKEKTLDSRQARFMELYNDPRSKTFGNAKQSAIKAGYSEKYGNGITALKPDWLYDKLRQREKLLEKAEKNLEKILDLPIKNDAQALKVIADISKFIAETVGKNDYSKRQELTGKDGETISLSTIFDIAVNHNGKNNDPGLYSNAEKPGFIRANVLELDAPTDQSGSRGNGKKPDKRRTV